MQSTPSVDLLLISYLHVVCHFHHPEVTIKLTTLTTSCMDKCKTYLNTQTQLKISLF